MKKRVAVIGAGPSGLAQLRAFASAGWFIGHLPDGARLQLEIASSVFDR